MMNMYKYLAVISSVCILGGTSGMKPTNEISSHKEGDNSAKYSNMIDDIQFSKIKDNLDNNSNDLEISTDSSEYSDEDLEDSDEDSESEANSHMPIQVVDNSKPTVSNSANKIVRIAEPESYDPHERKNQKESELLQQQLDNTSYENYNDLSDSFNSNVMKTLLFYTVENQKKLAEEIAKLNLSNLTEEVAKTNLSNLTEEVAKPNLSNLTKEIAKPKLSNLTKEIAKPNLSNLKSLGDLRKIVSCIHNKQDKQNFMLDKQSTANSTKKDSTK